MESPLFFRSWPDSKQQPGFCFDYITTRNDNNNVSHCTLKFFEDKDAAAKNVTVAKGHMYTLPAAPEKEGKTFVGWAESAVDPSDPGWKEPAEGDASILAAGTEYKVTENKSFVGIWK